MLSWVVLVASVLASVSSVWVGRTMTREALSADRSLEEALDLWAQGEEQWADDRPSGALASGNDGIPVASEFLPFKSGWTNWFDPSTSAEGAREMVSGFFSSRSDAEAMGWLLELSSSAKSLAARLNGSARGLVRIPFLSAVAASIATVAMERLDEGALTKASVCLGIGLTTSLSNQLTLRTARRALRSYREKIDALVRQSARLGVPSSEGVRA